jgi:hypothetical protein
VGPPSSTLVPVIHKPREIGYHSADLARIGYSKGKIDI